MGYLDKLHRLMRDESGMPPHQEESQPDDAVSRPHQAGISGRLIQPGDAITWQRADGSTPCGVVDFIHVDETGTRWAFVTLGEGWVAMNQRVAEIVKVSR